MGGWRRGGEGVDVEEDVVLGVEEVIELIVILVNVRREGMNMGLIMRKLLVELG